MVVICDDEIRPLLSCEGWSSNIGREIPSQDLLAAMDVPPVLCCYAWEVADTDLPGGKMFVGISLHVSSQQQQAFHEQLYVSYDRKYGSSVPERYYRTTVNFPLVADELLYHYVEDSTGEKVLGVLVTVCNIKYLPRVGLVKTNEFLENILREHSKGFVEELMTKQRVLKELSDDTHRWYADLLD